MKLLLIGDVVGKPGRAALLDRLQDLKEQHEIDFTVMNAENVAGGFSITAAIADLLFSSGIDVMTSGNHIFDKYEVIEYIKKQPRLLRPANYPPDTPGNGIWVGNVKGTRVAVLNLLGRVFMQPSDDPFRIGNELIGSLSADVTVRIVDMHAEATAEKAAMGWYLDGRVSVVYGTHTHVQTADERILHEGTAYITDLGMTGSYGGVIGMKKGDIISRFMSPLRCKPDHSKSEVRICGVVIDVDEETGRARSIERINLPHNQ
ncbi:MAG: TIGR00282 family metallophosphoesterase [Acidobacteria bacterium]|nr:MAG: TIGR00282 family metallophosphoesterase [Acidobacteriota bacterium]